jgi:cystathionine beta-lyase/cystathionine gamma-synthase
MEKEREEQAAIGAIQESVRVSVGLEDWEDLRDTFDLALEAARKVKAGQ